MFTSFFVGLGLGITGGIHCISMCGPLVFALPLGKLSATRQLIYSLCYHLARAFVYLLMGIGLFSIGNIIWRWGIFNIFSVVLGVSILLYTVIDFTSKKTSHFSKKIISTFSKKLNTLLNKKKKALKLFIFLGLLNGFLPCGLVYTALNTTFLYNNMLDVILFMIGFGLSTVPIMVSLRIVQIKLPSIITSKWRYIQIMITILIALLLIFRGLNIDVPFLVSKIDTNYKCF